MDEKRLNNLSQPVREATKEPTTLVKQVTHILSGLLTRPLLQNCCEDTEDAEEGHQTQSTQHRFPSLPIEE